MTVTQTEETTPEQTRIVYQTDATDTSKITAMVENGVATFTYAGSSAAIPVESLPQYSALVASVLAAAVPKQVEQETNPAPDPSADSDPVNFPEEG